jgi:glycerophosphoryl diester phosphodiesterase
MIHNIAHRGASAYEPENTLRAFERAIDMGATMLELDVHLSRDGHPVVIHDADLSRLTAGGKRVAELTLAEIQQFDAGLGEHVPSLAEVVELVRDRAQLYIELKGYNTPGPVVDLLRELGFLNQVIVGSFYPWLPQKVKFLEPAIRTSVLIRGQDREVDFVEWAVAVEANYVHPCWEHASPTPHKLLTQEMIAAIRQRDLGIIIWHEERPSELRALVGMDVDGICTNAPDLLTRILREYEEEVAT